MENISREVNGLQNPDLQGWCALSSYILFCNLSKKGHKPTFCANDAHAFLKWRKKYIDLTITQFGKDYPKIYCNPDPDEVYHVVLNKTQKKEKIWGKVCKDWHLPIPLDDPKVEEMIETY